MNSARILPVVLALAISSIVGAARAADYDLSEGYDPETVQRRGQAGMTFLQIGGSARAEGMGGAFSAAIGDPAVIFYNPAGVASIDGLAISATRTDWPADISVNHFAVAHKVGQVVAGLSFLSADFGDIRGTVRAHNPPYDYERTDDVEISAWALGGFVGAQLTDHFACGAHLKYVVEDFGSSQVFS